MSIQIDRVQHALKDQHPILSLQRIASEALLLLLVRFYAGVELSVEVVEHRHVAALGAKTNVLPKRLLHVLVDVKE